MKNQNVLEGALAQAFFSVFPVAEVVIVEEEVPFGSDFDIDTERLEKRSKDQLLSKQPKAENYLKVLKKTHRVIVPLQDMEDFVVICFKNQVRPQSRGFLRNKITGEYAQEFYI